MKSQTVRMKRTVRGVGEAGEYVELVSYFGHHHHLYVPERPNRVAPTILVDEADYETAGKPRGNGSIVLFWIIVFLLLLVTINSVSNGGG